MPQNPASEESAVDIKAVPRDVRRLRTRQVQRRVGISSADPNRSIGVATDQLDRALSETELAVHGIRVNVDDSRLATAVPGTWRWQG